MITRQIVFLRKSVIDIRQDQTTRQGMISVVIPTYHRNRPLNECLCRLAPSSQILSPDQYEVIVSDDAQSAETEAMVRQQFPWARWTAGPARGPAANRNNGASLAQGDWLAFTDDDCLASPGWLAAYSRSIAAGKGPVLEGRTTCEAGIHSILDQAPVNLMGGNLWSCNFAIERQAFEYIGSFDERFPGANAEDVEFHGRLRQAGVGIIFVPDAAVDHPPRPRRRGIAAGREWEGRVLLDILESKPLRDPMPVHVAKVRAAQLLAGRPSLDWILFAWSSLLEVTTVAVSHAGWAERYKSMTRIGPQRGELPETDRNLISPLL